MPTKLVMFATVLCFIGMMASADAADKNPRGTANSGKRADWCLEHMISCFTAGDEYCRNHTTDPVNLKRCNDAITDSCERSWGPTCNTEPLRAQRQDLGAINPNLPNQNAPVAPTPLSPRQQQLLQQQQMFKQTAPMQIAPRGVEGEPATTTPTEQEDKAPAPK